MQMHLDSKFDNVQFTLRYERNESQIFIFCTFLRRKCGTSDFLARLAEVKWPKSLANSNLYETKGKLFNYSLKLQQGTENIIIIYH